MACKIEIEQSIRDSIIKYVPYEGQVVAEKKARATVKYLNELWGSPVVKAVQYSSQGGYTIAINSLRDAVEKEYEKQIKAEKSFERNLDFFNGDVALYEQEEKSYQQKEGTESSIASPKTISLIKDLLKRIGVNIELMEKIVVNGRKYDSNSIAQIMQRLIQVVDGKEARSLPEEAMHFVVEIIKQKNPALYKQLMKEVNGYRLLNQVFTDYSNDSDYQTKDGKPDVVKLKEETIAKLLAERIIKEVEGTTEKPELLAKVETWWQQIVSFFRNLFSTSGFDKAAMDIIKGNLEGTTEDINLAEEKTFSQKSTQADIYNHIKAVSARIEKKIDENGEERYYIDGKRVHNRVSDLIHNWYESQFRDKALVKSDYRNAVDDLKKEKGTAGHADFEHAFHLFVDEEGYLREKEIEEDDYSPQIGSNDIYKILKDNLRDRLKSFPPGTRFMSEITIYDPRKAGRDIAGTIDLLAIEPDGKTSIYDWKFINLNTEKYEDIPWFKVKAWNKQMLQYKIILQNNYGIASEDFKQTRMIPIQAIYSDEKPKENVLPRLLEVKIGDVNVKNVEEDYLLPVGLQFEKTGNKRIDVLIEKLNAIYNTLSEKKVVSPEEKKNKAESLNALFKAIRQLQIKQNVVPLIKQAQILNKQASTLIPLYASKYEGKDPKSFTEQEKNDFVHELQDTLDAISAYTTLDVELESLFGETLSSEDKETLDKLTQVSNESRRLRLKLIDTIENFVANVIAKAEGVDSYLSPEKVIKGITKFFVSTAGLQLRSIEVLYKKANKAFAKAGFETSTESKILDRIKNNYERWAKSKGLGKKNYFDAIKKKDSNELIDEFKKDFYPTLKKKIGDKDFEWIRDNVDVEAYKTHLEEKLEKEIERIKNRPRILTQKEADELNETGKLPREVEVEINTAKKLYNISTKESVGWLLYDDIKYFPKRDTWESQEWIELNKPQNAPAKEFYDYIVEKNKEYHKLGYITNPRVFLPYIRKGLVESLVTGGKLRLGEQFLRSISLDEGDVGFGAIDPLNGKPKNIIPKYFTNEIDGEISTDLFHNMALYNEVAIRYKYLKDIEYQIISLVDVERNKSAIMTSMFGKTQIKNGEIQYTKDNSQNAKLVEDMMKMIIYGQKFIASENFDQLLFKLGTWGEKFNKKLGVNIFPENISERQVSINKIINTLNNQFQLVALGINPLAASSNFFGGNVQSLINAGTYFTKKDYMAAENMMFMNKFNKTDQKKMIGALEYFLPLTENYNREIAKKLSLNTLNQENIQDWLMILMRKTDLNVQTANFYAYLHNTIVMDGRLVNAREYLRSQPGYDRKYTGNKQQRDEFNEKFENEINRLINEKGVLKLAKIEKVTREAGGKKYETEEFVIPGIDRMSDDVVELRRKVIQISKDALGNLTEDDLRMINSTVYGKSMMVFKNWVPRLMDVRIGNLKYNAATDAYEWGRVRTVARVLTEDLTHSLDNLYGILVGNDRGIKFIQELYEKKRAQYKEDTGKDLRMTDAQFTDLVRANVKNQIYDIAFLLTLCLFIWGFTAFIPDDDEDEVVVNQLNFISRAATKFRGELLYFYDPTSITGILSTGIFPALGMITNFRKTVVNFSKEMYGLGIGDEELVKKTKVIKYAMRTFPITNQLTGYLPMFYPELAKDLGIRTTATYRNR